MTVEILAGFECAFLEQHNHDLLHTTRHVVGGDITAHYQIAKAHGIKRVRDGLVPGHDIAGRMTAAREAGIEVIWDLCHYHRIGNATQWAEAIACDHLTLHGPNRPLWVCPVNECSFAPDMCPGTTVEEHVDVALRLIRTLRRHCPVQVMTSEPMHTRKADWRALDALAPFVNVIGVNMYPPLLDMPIHELLITTAARYLKPIMISETSWHDFEGCGEFPGVNNKGEWLQHVISEIEIANRYGANVIGLCWYPIVDCPPWDDPSGERWSHGLIKGDLSVDPSLSAALKFNQMMRNQHEASHAPF